MRTTELPKEITDWIDSLDAHNVHYSYHDVLSQIGRLPEEQQEEASSRFHNIHEKRQERRRKQTIRANSKSL